MCIWWSSFAVHVRIGVIVVRSFSRSSGYELGDVKWRLFPVALDYRPVSYLPKVLRRQDENGIIPDTKKALRLGRLYVV